MSKLNAIVIATTLLFAAAAQADDAASQAAREQTAQAMRTEGVEHLIPAAASEGKAIVAKSRVRTEASTESKAEAKAAAPVKAAKPATASSESQPVKAEAETSPSRAAVIAELQRARRQGEMDFAAAEIGYQALPRATSVISADTRLAALSSNRTAR